MAVISPILEYLVSNRAQVRVTHDVIDASVDLRQGSGHDLASIDGTVALEYPSPPPSNHRDRLVRERASEGPAQLRDVLDSAARSELFPVDQAQEITVDNNIPRLQIIMHQALVAWCHAGGKIVELTDDTSQLHQPSWLGAPIVDRLAAQPGKHFLVAVDTEKSGSPGNALFVQAVKEQSDQTSVLTNRAAVCRPALAHPPDGT
ncbi:MAG: hypothetical protein AAF480_18655 [Actinomycetota bacterium]